MGPGHRPALRPPGASTTVVLSGDAGIGKTTLWRALVDEARERGLAVLATIGAEAEAQLSLAGARDLVAAGLDDVAADLPAPQRRILRVLLLQRGSRPTPAGPRGDGGRVPRPDHGPGRPAAAPARGRRRAVAGPGERGDPRLCGAPHRDAADPCPPRLAGPRRRDTATGPRSLTDRSVVVGARPAELRGDGGDAA